MIITRIRGGLGNQLFQYAAARSLAVRHGVELALDSAFYHGQDAKEVDYRKYQLHRFKVAGREIRATRARRQAMKHVPRWLRRMPGLNLPRYVRQREYQYGDWFEALPDHVYLDGWWQSEKFFAPIAAQLRQEITPADPAEIPPDVEALRASRKSVAVHVRRGDYLNFPEHHPVVGAAYLEAARAHFGADHDFMVFSNDLDWCRRHFRGDNVAFSEGRNELEDLVLMTACAHQIIANSSYSWWAAWLNPNPDKQVIAPARWFGPAYDHFDTSDVLPADWLVLDG